MAIVTALALKTDIHSYHDRLDPRNRHSYCDCLGHQNRHGYRDYTSYPNRRSWLSLPYQPSTPTFIFPELNRVSNARNLFKDSLQGTVHISLINARLSPVLCVIIFPCLRTLCHVLTFHVIVETSDMAQVLASRVGNVCGIDMGGWGRIFPGLLVI